MLALFPDLNRNCHGFLFGSRPIQGSQKDIQYLRRSHMTDKELKGYIKSVWVAQGHNTAVN